MTPELTFRTILRRAPRAAPPGPFASATLNRAMGREQRGATRLLFLTSERRPMAVDAHRAMVGAREWR